MMRIVVSQTVDLTEEQVHAIFLRRLAHLKDEQWIEGGKLYDEVYGSHRMDRDLGGKDHPRYELVETIQKLEQLLKAVK